MELQLLKSKIHQARVTEAILYYEGSLGIDRDLMDACGLLPYERILVVNANNGQRLETYVIVAERGSRTICLNGAAARLGEVGDVLTIMSFAGLRPEEVENHQPSIIIVDQDNQIIRKR